jgi:RNA polymerase sigma-70 factor (ECF subfamily)
LNAIHNAIDSIYRSESRRIFATLVRVLGDFDLAEEAMHEAFAAAMQQWASEGVPENPRAWLVSTARFKAIDAIRRRARFDAAAQAIAQDASNKAFDSAFDPQKMDEAQFNDDQLRLIFTCCHPALPTASQVALTLREVCGLTTEEVASAFLSTPATIAQRIVRGKAKIRDAAIPFSIPSVEELSSRLESVLAVIYLVFNEGYSASSGDSLTRTELSSEAIRLARLLLKLLPDPETAGLLALMLLHDARKAARVSPEGEIVLLEDQDRSLWNREQIEEGVRLVEWAFSQGEVGVYTLQAAISATHVAAPSPEETNWARICELYDLMLSASPSPVVALNRAVAVAMRDGPEAGLALIEEIAAKGELADYHLLHAARADLLRRLGRNALAKRAYEQALAGVRQEPERRFLEKRLRELV